MKKAIIFGDSISTFKNHIPEGYAVYYSEEGPNDVRDVRATWWYQVMDEAELELVRNDSWSSSTISYTALSGPDCSGTSSFITRLNRLIESGFFIENEIETVFVFGGTNDFWSPAKRGEIKHEDFTREDLFCTYPAICYFMKLLRETLPGAEIYCLINNALSEDIAECFEAACERRGITVVKFPELDIVNNHPTVRGMVQIKDTVLSAMKKK